MHMRFLQRIQTLYYFESNLLFEIKFEFAFKCKNMNNINRTASLLFFLKEIKERIQQMQLRKLDISYHYQKIKQSYRIYLVGFSYCSKALKSLRENVLSGVPDLN